MPEPLSRLQLARDEINKTFGPDFAEQHPELVIAVMNAASSDWAACANTVGPSCFTGARCTIVWPSQPPFGRIIETFIFWTCEVPHTRTQPASASYRNASSGLLACLPMHKVTDESSVAWKDGNMKTLITGSVAALAIALITGPVLTQPAFAEAPDSVIVGGKSIGADPDANVRFQMRRDVGSEGF